MLQEQRQFAAEPHTSVVTAGGFFAGVTSLLQRALGTHTESIAMCVFSPTCPRRATRAQRLRERECACTMAGGSQAVMVSFSRSRSGARHPGDSGQPLSSSRGSLAPAAFAQGLLFGSAEARELAAKGLGELVDHTTEVRRVCWAAPRALRIAGSPISGCSLTLLHWGEVRSVLNISAPTSRHRPSMQGIGASIS